MRLVVEEAAIWWWATKFSVTSRERISTIHNLQSIQLPLGDKPLPYLSLTLSLSFTIIYYTITKINDMGFLFNPCE